MRAPFSEMLPASGADLAISLWACCAARCFSICGRLKKYCQPISTRPDRMTARMVLRLSVIVQGLVIQFGLRLEPLAFLKRFRYASRCPLGSKTLLAL